MRKESRFRPSQLISSTEDSPVSWLAANNTNRQGILSLFPSRPTPIDFWGTPGSGDGASWKIIHLQNKLWGTDLFFFFLPHGRAPFLLAQMAWEMQAGAGLIPFLMRLHCICCLHSILHTSVLRLRRFTPSKHYLSLKAPISSKAIAPQNTKLSCLTELLIVMKICT